MNYLPLRILLTVALASVFGAVITRMVWEGIVNPFAGTLTLVSLVVLMILASFALFVYLTVKPSWAKLRSLPVVIGVTVITTMALLGTSFHFIRFIPSPEGAPVLSKVIAVLLILSIVTACSMILWAFWSMRKSKEN